MFNSHIKKANAAAAAASAAAKANRQFLTFLLGSEVFALDILVIREIIQFGEISTVPMMPDYIRGIINLRGACVPVIDLHVRFGHGAAEPGKRTCIVIIEITHQDLIYDLGIMVDAVSAVIEIENSQIEAPPRFGGQVRNEFIAAMGKVNDQFVIILDAGKTFTPDELEAMDSAINTRGEA